MTSPASSPVHPVDLEPSLIGPQTYATRRTNLRLDVALVVGIMICLLYMLPARLIVPNMTFAGRPALLVAFGLFAWWLVARLSPRLLVVGPQPLRWAALFYLLSIMGSYIAGMLRGLPSMEANQQNFTVLITFQFLGVILMTADGLANWERLRWVLRVFVVAAGFMAIVGLIQSTFKYDIARLLVIPGLELKIDLADFQPRGEGGLFRVPSTAVHYIEFSTVMAMAVPFALHLARYASTTNRRFFFAILTALIAASVPVAISRTGVLALGIVFITMFLLGWNWRTRFNLAILGVGLTALLVVARPGLIGTLSAMFLSVNEDTSISGRTDDYEIVGHWFAQRPWLGRGPGTLVPDLYIILDNQWLLTLVTGGIIGVLALAALHLTAISLGWMAMKRAATEEDKHLCAALLSAQFVAIVVGGTFDSFSFTTFSFTLALTTGLAGAAWRLTHPSRVIRTSTVNRLFE
ncbi:O-antigen ligase family protein [Actinoplanes sp. NPDC026670]|uniref:O-antigen ligase family protein n=1 Tax=Actinoplanes sp. NPDC026670 TaxID=3154700 RepID=UPI003402EA92